MTASANKWSFALSKEDDGATVVLDILDVIGDWCGPNAVTARGTIAALDAAKDAKTIRARINSAGGEVTEGLAIYNALSQHPARVEVVVMGLAASMASVIAMAGDTITMAQGSFMMIHNPWTIAAGDGDDMRHAADFLDKLRDSLVGIYATRTKKPAEAIATMMADETWMKAEEAVTEGFADKVEGKKPAAAQGLAYAALTDFTKVPEELKAALTARASSPVPTPPAPDGTAPTNPIGEGNSMSEKNNDPTNTISVARALGLPAGATEQDAITRSVALRELEVLILALTGEKNIDAAVGVVRGSLGAAEKLKAANAELASVKAERDAQNFEALVSQGKADSKLTPAEEKFEREEFARAVEDGRGASAVERLRGMLKVKAADPRFTRTVKEPNASAGSGTPLVWNGKAWKDLKPAQRSALSKENPELYQLMRQDHIDSTGAAA